MVEGCRYARVVEPLERFFEVKRRFRRDEPHPLARQSDESHRTLLSLDRHDHTHTV